MSNLNYRCPHCGVINTFHPSQIGKTTECLKCDGRFSVPAPVAVPVATRVEERAEPDRRRDESNRRRDDPRPQKRSTSALGWTGCFTLVIFGVICLYVVGRTRPEENAGNRHSPVERYRGDDLPLKEIEIVSADLQGNECVIVLRNKGQYTVRNVWAQIEVYNRSGTIIDSAEYCVFASAAGLAPGEKVSRTKSITERGAASVQVRLTRVGSKEIGD